jgi:oligopeptidase A
MATLEGAEALMEELRAASWDAAKADLAEVQRFAKEHGEGEELRQWDVSFWAERLRCVLGVYTNTCLHF